MKLASEKVTETELQLHGKQLVWFRVDVFGVLSLEYRKVAPFPPPPGSRVTCDKVESQPIAVTDSPHPTAP